MNKRIFFFGLFVIGVCFLCNSQDKKANAVTSRFDYSGFTAIGRSLFKSSIDAPTKFSTAEARVGGSVTWVLNNHFEINTRLVLDLKIKREKDSQPYPYNGLYISQNDMAGRDHYFFEIPVILQYRFSHPKISLGMGVSYRQFFNINSVAPGFDPLSGKKEAGVIGRAAYRFNNRISIGIEQYIALNNLYTSSGTVDGEEFYLSVKNRYTQITFEYRLRKD